MLDLGQTEHVTTSPVDASGNRVDITGLVVTIGLPDGTDTGALTPTHDGTGAYSHDYVTTQAGRHTARWAGTGWAYTDTFDVWPADPRFLITLDDARSALRTSFTGNDDDLRLYIAAVTPVIEDITGPVVLTQHVRTYDGDRTAICLQGSIVAGSVSILENGQAMTDFTVNTRSGIVYAGQSLAPRRFFPGNQNIQITYKVGSATTPPNVLLAAREELRFLWQVGQQAQGLGAGDLPEDTALTPSGFYTFRRVLELCAASPRVPGFA